jgi:hypothetical protein
MKKGQKIALVTFGLFMTEAIIHYNIGKKDVQKEQESKGILPPTKSLINIALTVGAFSVLNSILLKEV